MSDFETHWARKLAAKTTKRQAKLERELQLKTAKQEYDDKVHMIEERYRWTKKQAKRTNLVPNPNPLEKLEM